MIILPSGFDLPNNPLIGWRNIVTVSNVTATQQMSTAPVTQLANPATYNPWSGTTAAEQVVQVSLEAAEAIDYVGIAVHNLGSAGITYHVEYSDDNAAWNPADSGVAPLSDGVILHVFDQVSAQFWRIRFEAGMDPPSIAVLYMGRILQIPRRIYVGHTPINMGRETDIRTGRSESGQFLGRVVKRRLYATSISVDNLEPDWYRANFDEFADAASGDTPFFFGWRPTTYWNEVGYAWAMRDIIPENQRSNGMMSVSFPIQGLVGNTEATSTPSSS